MALKVYIITKNGNRNEGVFYFHEQAFSKAISLETLFEMPVIEEHQWHSATNSLVTKTYYSRDKSIYVKEDFVNPIYSLLPAYSSIIFYRKVIYAMCRKAIKTYLYYNLPCPYVDEYIYSFTLLELKDLENRIKSDNVIVKFNKDIEFITTGILDTAKVLNINLPEFYRNIMVLDATEMVLYVKTIEKQLKKHLLKNVYGVSYIDNF